MAKFRMVRTDFWKNPLVSEEMSPEDKYFYLYLFTNPDTTQIGIYKITKKQMAFDLGYSIETVHALMERFTKHHKLIRYNPETREIALKDWAKYNLQKGGKPVMDCIISELKEVEDLSLIHYISGSIQSQDIRCLYDSFCKQEEVLFGKGKRGQDENDTYLDLSFEEPDDPNAARYAINGQYEKENEKQLEKGIHSASRNNSDMENQLPHFQHNVDVQEIIEFWDQNGFGLSNMNAKQQLLSWLDDSSFLKPKDVVLKAMNIACANNKRSLNYVIGILRNWENESLLSVEEIDSYQERQRATGKSRHTTESIHSGRVVPAEFTLDLTAGEE